MVKVKHMTTKILTALEISTLVFFIAFVVTGTYAIDQHREAATAIRQAAIYKERLSIAYETMAKMPPSVAKAHQRKLDTLKAAGQLKEAFQ